MPSCGNTGWGTILTEISSTGMHWLPVWRASAWWILVAQFDILKSEESCRNFVHGLPSNIRGVLADAQGFLGFPFSLSIWEFTVVVSSCRWFSGRNAAMLYVWVSPKNNLRWKGFQTWDALKGCFHQIILVFVCLSHAFCEVWFLACRSRWRVVIAPYHTDVPISMAMQTAAVAHVSIVFVCSKAEGCRQ